MLSGAVKWSRAPIVARVHYQHVEMLRRGAESGRSWAHAALETDAPLYYVAAAGFSDEFLEAARSSGHPVACWTLDDLYTV